MAFDWGGIFGACLDFMKESIMGLLSFLREWFVEAFHEGLAHGWADCGGFLLQTCITLLAFSTFLPRFREIVVTPAQKRLREKDEVVQAAGIASDEAKNPQLDSILQKFRRKSSAAAEAYKQDIESIIAQGKKSSAKWTVVAVILFIFGAHHWLGLFVLFTLKPVYDMYRKSRAAEKNAAGSMDSALGTLEEMQEAIGEANNLQNTLHLFGIDASLQTPPSSPCTQPKKNGRNTRRKRGNGNASKPRQGGNGGKPRS